MPKTTVVGCFLSLFGKVWKFKLQKKLIENLFADYVSGRDDVRAGRRTTGAASTQLSVLWKVRWSYVMSAFMGRETIRLRLNNTDSCWDGKNG